MKQGDTQNHTTEVEQLTHVLWKRNPGPLQEQQTILIIKSSLWVPIGRNYVLN